MSKNTAFEVFDEIFDENTEENTASREEILMNEMDILNGLLEAANAKNDESLYRHIEIRREGKLLYAFRIRPLSEEENQKCYKSATKYAKPKHSGAPKTAIETDYVRLRSLKIYSATVDEDRAKVWDNKVVLERLNLLHGVDLVEKALLGGEKNGVCDLIDEISGFDKDIEGKAKN